MKDDFNKLTKSKSFVSTKSNKVKKIVKLEKNVDIDNIKKKLLQENERIKKDRIKNEFIPVEGKLNSFENAYINDIKYEAMFKKYINEVYDSKIMSMTARMINLVNLPDGAAQKYPIQSMLLKICRHMLFNHFELSVYAIYLDRLGWFNNNFEFNENLLLVAIITKMHTSLNSDEVVKALFKNIKGLEESYKRYAQIKIEPERYNVLEINPKEINEKYEKLSEPFNSFCKQNFIDYNFCVDQILSMSLPYSESKKNQDTKSVHTITIPQNNFQHYNNNNMNKNNLQNAPQSSINEMNAKLLFSVIGNNPFVKTESTSADDLRNNLNNRFGSNTIKNNIIPTGMNTNFSQFQPFQNSMENFSGNNMQELYMRNALSNCNVSFPPIQFNHSSFNISNAQLVNNNNFLSQKREEEKMSRNNSSISNLMYSNNMDKHLNTPTINQIIGGESNLNKKDSYFIINQPSSFVSTNKQPKDENTLDLKEPEVKPKPNLQFFMDLAVKKDK